ncbi:hypothetical protein HDU76_000306 [Blyttiomyces sp. JEL0837]|nr:hypothetical protein HDU76_000306 [Blyttiomyces sp. JEL0837]
MRYTTITKEDLETGWDIMLPIDALQYDERVAYNNVMFDSYSEVEFRNGYPFHPTCFKLIQLASTSKRPSFTLKDLYDFLELRYKRFRKWPPIPPVKYSLDPNVSNPTIFKSFYPDHKFMEEHAQEYCKLLIKNCWMMAPIDSLDTYAKNDNDGVDDITQDDIKQALVAVKGEKQDIADLEDYITSPNPNFEQDHPLRRWMVRRFRRDVITDENEDSTNNVLSSNNDEPQTIPILGPLPDVVIDIILEILSPADLLNLTSTSRSWYSQSSIIWRSRCNRDGFACDPIKNINDEIKRYDDMDVTWKRVYFCYESRNRRRIDDGVRWIATEVSIFKGFQPRVFKSTDVIVTGDDSESDDEEDDE